MRTGRIVLSVTFVSGFLALTLAVAAIWLLLTDPVTVADAVQRGDVAPIVRALGSAIYDAMKGVFRYL